jgi:phosphoribosylcarboxyaminoimidazole (NCAIR) mutase
LNVVALNHSRSRIAIAGITAIIDIVIAAITDIAAIAVAVTATIAALMHVHATMQLPETSADIMVSRPHACCLAPNTAAAEHDRPSR